MCLAKETTGFKPVKEMDFQKCVSLIEVLQPTLALFQMMHPVYTGVSEVSQETSVYLASIHVRAFASWSFEAADIFPEMIVHDLEASVRNLGVIIYLIYREVM